MAGTHSETTDAFPVGYLDALAKGVRGCPYVAEFPFFELFLRRALRADCNAFYLNPLQLEAGSRVDPHVDRSLRAYCKDVATPLHVSVLYVDVPPVMQGGELVLARGKRVLARVRPLPNLLVGFDGDLTHSIARVGGEGRRLSLVCEQYALDERELDQVPDYELETRAKQY